MPLPVIFPTTVADQENFPPTPDSSIAYVTANVHSAVVDAMAGKLDKSIKNQKKRWLGKRLDDPKKTEVLFHKISDMRLLFNFADKAKQDSELVSNAVSYTMSPNSLSLVIEVLDFIASTEKFQLKESCMLDNHTKSKHMAV